MLEVFPLFPQAVARVKYQHHETLKKRVFDFMEDERNNHLLQNDGIENPFVTHYFNSADSNRVDFFDCIDDRDFKYFLVESSTIFVRDVLGCALSDEMLVTDCWINNCPENGKQKMHNHCNSFISGTYYLNYDSENHSPLKFEHPVSYAVRPYMMLDTNEVTEFNHVESYCQFIEEGDLVLWSSFLQHGYDLNKKDGRTTISMNFLPPTLKSGPYTFRVQK